MTNSFQFTEEDMDTRMRKGLGCGDIPRLWQPPLNTQIPVSLLPWLTMATLAIYAHWLEQVGGLTKF